MILSETMNDLKEYFRSLIEASVEEPVNEMKFEILRIASFVKAPNYSYLSILSIAQKGFYYSGDGTLNRVTCFSCRTSLPWDGRDSLLEAHRRQSPNCLYLCYGNENLPDPERNITLQCPADNWTLEDCIQEIRRNSQILSNHGKSKGTEHVENEGQNTQPGVQSDIGAPRINDVGNLLNRLSLNVEKPQSDYGTYSVDNSNQSLIDNARQNPNAIFFDWMKNSQERLKTFHDFPGIRIQRPELFAEAGLFFTGEGDVTQCAFCKVKIHKWQTGDVPVVEHRKMSPNCSFFSIGARNVPINSKLSANSLPFTPSNVSPRPPLTISPVPLVVGPSNQSDSGISDPRREDDFAYKAGMKSELERRKTFHDYPRHTPKPEALAAAGFYYIGIDDHTKCAFCGGLVSNWNARDIPMVQHRVAHPNCPFITGSHVGNIPIVLLRDENGHNPPQQQLSSMMDPTRPKFPHNASLQTRVETFNNWQSDHMVDRNSLANAGFFYTGQEDITQCFHCGGRLGKWAAGDDPWEEHALKLPGCGFVAAECAERMLAESVPSPSPAASLNENPAVAQGSNISSTGGDEHQINAKEIKARMDTDQVKMLLERGYSYNSIKTVIEHKLRTTGDNFPSITAMVEAMTEAQSSGATVTASIPEPTDRRPAFVEEHYEPPSHQGSSSSSSTPSMVELNSMSELDKQIIEPALRLGYTMEQIDMLIDWKRRSTGKGYGTSTQLLNDLKKIFPLVHHDEVVPAIKKRKRKRELPKKPANLEETSSGPTHSGTSTGSSDLNSETQQVPKLLMKYRQLAEENKDLKEAKVCKICMDKDADTVFLPCKHMVCCPVCAPKVKDCPICRGTINASVSVFKS